MLQALVKFKPETEEKIYKYENVSSFSIGLLIFINELFLVVSGEADGGIWCKTEDNCYIGALCAKHNVDSVNHPQEWKCMLCRS